jgi:hypothetical protein
LDKKERSSDIKLKSMRSILHFELKRLKIFKNYYSFFALLSDKNQIYLKNKNDSIFINGFWDKL